MLSGSLQRASPGYLVTEHRKTNFCPWQALVASFITVLSASETNVEAFEHCTWGHGPDKTGDLKKTDFENLPKLGR